MVEFFITNILIHINDFSVFFISFLKFFEHGLSRYLNNCFIFSNKKLIKCSKNFMVFNVCVLMTILTETYKYIGIEAENFINLILISTVFLNYGIKIEEYYIRIAVKRELIYGPLNSSSYFRLSVK